MSSHSSIRGIIAYDNIPEFLLKYLDIPTNTTQNNGGNLNTITDIDTFRNHNAVIGIGLLDRVITTPER